MMIGRRRSVALAGAILLGLSMVACSESNPGPAGPLTNPPLPPPLDVAAVLDALNYWQAAAGITYVLTETAEQPRMIIRQGVDGLAPWGGGRGGIDGTYAEDNRARSGLVVIEPGGGNYCRSTPASCRYLYRHEIGHALGFLGHSGEGLMSSGSDSLTARELRMITALYALPHGAVVASDGTWSVPASGASGMLDDVQTAQDVMAWNMNATGGSSYRQLGVISRWELPVRVYILR